MEKLFLQLVNMSITAGWIVTVLLLIRPLLKKAPRWFSCLMWAPVGLRLIFPFSVESVLSLIPSAVTVPQNIAQSPAPAVQTGVGFLNRFVNPVIYSSFAPKPYQSVNPLQVLEFVAARMWVIGVVCMLLYALFSAVMLKLKLRTATKLQKGVYQSEFVASPFILGKTVYIPYGMPTDELKYCLLHERAHLKRGDHLIKPLSFVILSVYWFNPLLWLAFVLLCRDIELACDEKVIKDLSKDECRQYSAALLKNSVSRKRIAACPIAFGEVGVKERIKSVMSYKRPAFWVIVTSAAVGILLSVCFLTNPAGVKIENNFGDIFSNVNQARVVSGAEYDGMYTDGELDKALSMLKKVRLERNPVSEDRSEDRDKTNRVMLFDGSGKSVTLCFSADCTELWLDDSVKPSLSYKVKNPDAVRKLFSSGGLGSISQFGGGTMGGLTVLSYGSDIDGVSISLGAYDFGEKPYLDIVWKNNTANDLVIGRAFDLLYSDGNTNSYSCAKGDVKFTEEGYVIPARGEGTMRYSLEQFDVSKNGWYTFNVLYAGGFVWMDFAIFEEDFYSDYHIEVLPVSGENETKLYSRGNALSPISSVRFLPVFRIDSVEAFEDFCNEYSFISLKNGGSLDGIAKTYDESFFADYSIVITYMPTSSSEITPLSGEFAVNGDNARLTVYAQTPKTYTFDQSAWLLVTHKPKSELSGVENLTAIDGGSVVCLKYLSSPEPTPPKLYLCSDGRFGFYWSALSSYYAFGSYKQEGDRLILTTEDGQNTYVFTVDGEDCIFDEKSSSPIPKYRYSEGGEPQSPVADGARFE